MVTKLTRVKLVRMRTSVTRTAPARLTYLHGGGVVKIRLATSVSYVFVYKTNLVLYPVYCTA